MIGDYLKNMAGRAELLARVEVLDERCERYQKLLEECRAILGPQWPQVELVDVPGRLDKWARAQIEDNRILQDKLRITLGELQRLAGFYKVERLFRELARAGREAAALQRFDAAERKAQGRR